jgi:hypothetical protein
MSILAIFDSSTGDAAIEVVREAILYTSAFNASPFEAS